MTLFLGVDGGGSKTRAIVCDVHGSIVAEGEGPSSNPISVGFEQAGAALKGAVAATSVRRDAIAAGCFGVAGVDREEDRTRLERWVIAQDFAPRAVVVHDSELVLAAGTPDGWGVGLICGTGTIAFGTARSGQRARAGGLGWLIGDEGSGYAIGVAALRAAMHSVDGRNSATTLLAAVLEEYHLETPADLVAHVYRPAATRAEIARLARVVLALQDAGDASARAIIVQAATDAGALVSTVMRRLGEPDAPLALAGGLVAHAGYRADICSRGGVPEARTILVDDPARGAVILARRLVA